VRDTSNRDSLWFADASPLALQQQVHVKIPTMPTEHVFKAGHQIGIVVAGANAGCNGCIARSITGNDNVPVTLDTKQSKITLPILGGYRAIASAQGTDAETVAPVLNDDVPADILTATTDPTGTVVNYTNPTATDNEDPNPVVTCAPAAGSRFPVGTTTVTCTARDANGNVSAPKAFKVVVRRDVPVNGTPSGTVPATLSLSLGPAAQFSSFIPGITKTYEASTEATVTSTAGDALLSVSDPSSTGTGHLVNGSFVLPEPLQARARNAANTGTAYNDMNARLNLLTWSAPITKDQVSLEFSQLVTDTNPLRTGTYAKALTFTLSTTTP
jgi:X-Pro dipeptidyl-peptidase